MAERRGLAQIVNFPRVTGGFRAIPVSTGDPDFASVVLLLDFDGVDAATDITDLSNSAHVDTFAGGAQVDTAQQFLGVNSALFAATGDEITFPDSADWDFGTGDFTVECGVRWVGTPGNDGLISSPPTATGWYMLGNGTSLRFVNNDLILSQQSFTFVTDVWYHVAVSRSGTDLRLFVDGVQIGSTVTDSTSVNGGTSLFLGALLANSNPLDGHIGAVRITKGVARYTANFTPLTVFYPTS